MAAGVSINVDASQVAKLPAMLAHAKDAMKEVFIPAFRQIKEEGVAIARADMMAGLRIRSKNVPKAISGWSNDKAKNLEELKASIYTRSRLLEGQDKGGTIRGHGKQLTVMFGYGRGASGKRRYTQRQLRQAIAERKVKMVPSPRGVLLVETGTISSKGNFRAGRINKSKKGFSSVVIGILKRAITLQKRTHFYQTEQKLQPKAETILANAAETGLQKIVETQ